MILAVDELLTSSRQNHRLVAGRVSELRLESGLYRVVYRGHPTGQTITVAMPMPPKPLRLDEAGAVVAGVKVPCLFRVNAVLSAPEEGLSAPEEATPRV